MKITELAQNPITFAVVMQFIGLIVAQHFDTLGEAIIVSLLFWILVRRITRRKHYTIGDQLFIRFGIVVFISIVVALWGRWGVKPY
jgi:hypothetical protein